MINFLRRYRIVIIVVLTDLLLFWVLFRSIVVLPFINPSVEQYKILLNGGTGFPRNTNQMIMWIILHLPTSYIIGGIARSDMYQFLSVIQTGLITYYIDKHLKQRKKIENTP